MPVDSKITVRIRGIVEGLPQMQQFVNTLKGIKGQGLQGSLFSGLKTGPLNEFVSQVGKLGPAAQQAGRTITATFKKVGDDLVPVVKLGNAAKEATTLFSALGLTVKNSGFKLATFDVANLASGIFSAAAAAGALIAKIVALAGVVGGTLTAAFITLGVQFNSLISSSRVSLAAIIASASSIKDAFTGQVLTGLDAFNAGLALSDSLIERIRKSAAALGVPFEGVLRSVQDGIGPGLANAGFSLQQIAEIVPKIAVAAQTVGLPLDQFAQEIRALLSGDIDRNARVAQILQIKPADVERLKVEPQKFFDFLTERLKSFAAAGPEIAKTISGAFTLLSDQLNRFAGEATKGLTVNLVRALTLLRTSFLDSTGDFTKPVKEFLALLNQAFSFMSNQLVKGVNALIIKFNELLKDPLILRLVLSDVLGVIYAIVKGTFAVIDNLTKSTSAGSRLLNVTTNIFAFVKTLGQFIAGIADLVVITFRAVKFGIVASSQLIKPFLLVANAVGLISDGAKAAIDSFIDINAAANDLKDAFTNSNAVVFGRAADEALAELRQSLKLTNFEFKLLQDVFNKFTVTGNAKKVEDKKKKAGAEPEPVLQSALTDLRGAQLAVTKAQLEAESDLLVEQLNTQQIAVEQAYATRKTTIEKYYSDIARIEKEKFQIEIQKLQDQLKAVNERITGASVSAVLRAKQIRDQAGKDDPAITQAKLNNAAVATNVEIERSKAEQAKIQGQINVLTERQVGIQQTVLNNQNNALKAFDQQFNSLRSQILEFKGAFADAALLNFKDQNGDLLDLLENLSVLTNKWNSYRDILREIRRISVEEGQQRQFTNKLSEAQLKADIAISKVKLSREQELINEVQLQDAIAEIEKERINTQIALLQSQLAITTNTNTQLEIQKQIAELQVSLVQTRNFIQQTFKDVKDSITGSIGDAFADIITGTNNVKDAFRSLASSIISSLARIAANAVVNQLIGALVGAFGGALAGGAAGNAATSGGGGFAEGGQIHGPGTETSDSILAKLSKNEYVIRASAVRLFGKDFFDQLNAHRIPRFATGSGPANPALKGQSIGDRVSLTNVNVFDPRMLTDVFSSNAGRKVFLNTVSANRESLKRILR